MYSLIRLLFRALNGKPRAQLTVGIIMIPVGGLLSIAAAVGDSIYPYWVLAGIALIVVGIVFIIRSIKALAQPKPSVQQTAYNAPGQYVPQAPYGQPQQPYAQPQAPYGQPYAPGQPYPSEYIPGQQQAPYGQPSYPPPYVPGQQQ